MSVGFLGAFASLGAITAQCLSPYPSLLGDIRTGGKTFQPGGNMYGLPPLQLESYLIFVVCIHVAFECQRWKRDEVAAQQWGMGYFMKFYVDPSVVRAKRYGKVTVACDGGCSPVRKTQGSATLSVVGKVVGVRHHVACYRAISDILHDYFA